MGSFVQPLIFFLFWCGLGFMTPVHAQKGTDEKKNDLVRDVKSSLDDLDLLQTEISKEKIPLRQSIRELENELKSLRSEHRRLQRLSDHRDLNLADLEKEIQQLEDELNYGDRMLDEFAREFHSRIHLAEIPLYEKSIREARRQTATGTNSVPNRDRFQSQTRLLNEAIDRIGATRNGRQFQGKALGPDGVLMSGTVSLVGPVAMFAADQEILAGMLQVKGGSPEPSVIPLPPEHARAIENLSRAGEGAFPLDPTLGQAITLARHHESVIEHMMRGGVIMIPIGVLAIAYVILGFWKWWQISRIQTGSNITVREIVHSVLAGDRQNAINVAQAVKGPVGDLLLTAVQNSSTGKAWLEEILFERILHARPGLEKGLAFLATTAAVAPLLGLLGTVTGMIETFRMITLFGTGDAQVLSGGISEALVTTEFGLIVAVPALLMHAFLSRRIKGILSGMERHAVGFINAVCLDESMAKSPLSEERGKSENSN